MNPIRSDLLKTLPPPRRYKSDRHPVTVEFVVLVVAPLAGSEVGEIRDEIDGFDPLDVFEAQFVLAAKPQRRSVQYADRLSIHFIGQKCQMVGHVFETMDIVIPPAFASFGE